MSTTRDSDGHGQENSSKSSVRDAAQHPESYHIILSTLHTRANITPIYQSHITHNGH